MMVELHRMEVETRGESEVLEITPQVREILERSGLRNGLVTVFVPGSTAAVTTTEFEPGLRRDLPAFFERVAPRDIRYAHDDTWGDGNGHAHVRASLLGPSLGVPVTDGEMILGTWQNIVVIDFDNRPRRRRIVVQLLGE
jgi:secondary thiamine-phosphate synthase enzyme